MLKKLKGLLQIKREMDQNNFFLIYNQTKTKKNIFRTEINLLS